jgi:3-dehydroquinate dehydratase-1
VGTISSAEFLDQYAATAPEARIADLAEARLDLFEGLRRGREEPSEADVARWLDACARLEATGTPVIVTVRLEREGGKWSGRDEDRLPLFQRALAAVSWVDIEASSAIAAEVVRRAHAAGKRAVASHHDFERTPAREDLQRLIAEARATDADIAKLAATVNTDDERDRLFDLLARRTDDRLCLIAMGPDASTLRVQLPSRGSVLAYAFLDAAAAPGQLSAATMSDRLRAECPAYRARRA